MSPDFVKVHRSVSGHVAALVYSESNSQAATRGPGAVLGSPFLPQASPSTKWVDQRRKAVRKHFYTNKSFQILDALLIITPMPIPAKEGARHSQE